MRLPIALSCAIALLLAGCGGDPEPSPEAQVRAKLAEFNRATAAKDYAALCARVYSSGLTSRTEAIGLPCDVALRRALAEVDDPQLTVGDVTVDGSTARAQVRSSAKGQAPSRDTVELRKEKGGWRIVQLAGGGGEASPSPTPTPAEG